MNSNADVTIIVPTFNRAAYLSESLTSLLGQSRPARELIVVDDGSTDRTAEILASFGDRITVLRKPNGGKSSALNLALGVASGASIWIFDDDDVAAPEALARLSDALEGTPQADFVAGNLLRFRDQGGRRRFARPPVRALSVADFHFQQLARMSVFQGSMLVRRRCYEAVGAFDEAMPRAQDYDMLLRLSRRFTPALLDAVIFFQRQHEDVRGPAALRIAGTEIWARQNAFDAMVLSKARRSSSLTDVLPRPHISPLSPASRFEAHLRWASVLARRQKSTLAAHELESALALSHAHAVDPLSPDTLGAVSELLLLSVEQSDPFVGEALSLVAGMPQRRVRAQLLKALSWQLFLGAGKHLGRRRFDGLRHTLRLYGRATRGRFLASHVGMLLAHLSHGRSRRISSPQ